MNYIKGKIILINNNKILVQVNNIAYFIDTYKIEKFINQKKPIKLFLIPFYNNLNISYLGCHNYDEYNIINKLLKVKGVGKMKVISIMNKTKVSELIKDIKA